jgi:hypothetical protein
MDIEDLDVPTMGSVIYMGRGSFRMEAVALEPESLACDGVVQPIAGIVTAPLHAAPLRERSGNVPERGPSVRPLFGSQVDVPVLAAPSGAVSLPAPVVTLSRPMLATVCGVVLLCGIVVGTAVRHLLAAPAPLAVLPPAAVTPLAAAVAPVAVAVAPVTVAFAPVAAAAPPSAPVADTAPPSPPPVVTVPAPVTIRAHAKTLARVAGAGGKPATKIAVAPEPRPWVDPWAE